MENIDDGIAFYLIDTETTGLSTSIHEVIEISVIRFKDKYQLSQTIKCDTPQTASYDALKITGKTLSDLYKGDSKENVINKLNKFLLEDGKEPNGRCFIAHNAPFDRKFMHSLYAKVGQECPVWLWVDTLSIMRKYGKDNNIKGKYDLHSSCDLLGIKKVASKHNAKDDTRNLYFMYKNLRDVQQIDFLPFIKSFPHKLTNDDEYLDASLLDD